MTRDSAGESLPTARQTLATEERALNALLAVAEANQDAAAIATARTQVAAATTAVATGVGAVTVAETALVAPQGVADTNRDNTTVITAEPLQSGLYVPLYAGFSYSLNELIGFPVTAEVLYRYAIVAPQGFEETLRLFRGVRYHFDSASPASMMRRRRVAPPALCPPPCLTYSYMNPLPPGQLWRPGLKRGWSRRVAPSLKSAACRRSSVDETP